MLPVKKSVLRLPEDLHRRVKIAAVQRDTSIKEAIEVALKLWLDGKPPETPKLPASLPNMGYRPQHRDAHELLEFILSHGDKDQHVNPIVWNLKNFERSIKSDKPHRKTKPGS